MRLCQQVYGVSNVAQCLRQMSQMTSSRCRRCHRLSVTNCVSCRAIELSISITWLGRSLSRAQNALSGIYAAAIIKHLTTISLNRILGVGFLLGFRILMRIWIEGIDDARRLTVNRFECHGKLSHTLLSRWRRRGWLSDENEILKKSPSAPHRIPLKIRNFPNSIFDFPPKGFRLLHSHHLTHEWLYFLVDWISLAKLSPPRPISLGNPHFRENLKETTAWASSFRLKTDGAAHSTVRCTQKRHFPPGNVQSLFEH